MINYEQTTIAELKSFGENSCVQFFGIKSKELIKSKRDLSRFLLITVCDKTDSVDIAIWDDWEKYNTRGEEIVSVKGVLSFWNGQPQIKNPIISRAPDLDRSKFIVKYEIIPELMKEFEDTFDTLPGEYQNVISQVTGYLNNEEIWNKFITFPAAINHHGNRVRGGFLHTMGVMRTAKTICAGYFSESRVFSYDINPGEVEMVDVSKVLLKCILHDFGKMYEYQYDSGVCKRNPMYNKDHRIIGGEKLTELYALGHLNISEDLLEELRYTILCHHGEFGEWKINSLEDKIVHLSDMVDSHVVSGIENFVEVD